MSITPSTVLTCPQKWPLPHKTFFSGDVCPGVSNQCGPSLTCLVACAHWILQIHLWCDISQSLEGQHYSPSLFDPLLFQALVGLKPIPHCAANLKYLVLSKVVHYRILRLQRARSHYRFGLLRTTIIHCMIKKTRISLKEFTEMVGSGRRVYILNSYLLSQKAKKTEQIIFVHCWLSL